MTIKKSKKSSGSTSVEQSSSSSTMSVKKNTSSSSSATKQKSGKKIRYIDVKVEKEDPLIITELPEHHTVSSTISEHYSTNPHYIITEAPSIQDLSQSSIKEHHVSDMAMSKTGEFISNSVIHELSTSHQHNQSSQMHQSSSTSYETTDNTHNMNTGFIDSNTSSDFLSRSNTAQASNSLLDSERNNVIHRRKGGRIHTASGDFTGEEAEAYERVTKVENISQERAGNVVRTERESSLTREILSPEELRMQKQLNNNTQTAKSITDQQKEQFSSSRYELTEGQQQDVTNTSREWGDTKQFSSYESSHTVTGTEIQPQTEYISQKIDKQSTYDTAPNGLNNVQVTEESLLIREGKKVENIIDSRSQLLTNDVSQVNTINKSSNVTESIISDSINDVATLKSASQVQNIHNKTLDEKVMTEYKNAVTALEALNSSSSVSHMSTSDFQNMQQTSTSSKIYEVINGQERIIDNTNREWGDSTELRTHESSYHVTGSNIEPKSEYAKSSFERESVYDTGINGVPIGQSNVKEESILIKDGKQVASTSEHYTTEYKPQVTSIDKTDVKIYELDKNTNIADQKTENVSSSTTTEFISHEKETLNKETTSNMRDTQTSYDRSTGAWNGKFVMEKPVNKPRHHLQRQDTEQAIILSSSDISDFKSINELRKIIKTSKKDVTINNNSIVINKTIDDSVLQEIIDTVKRYPFKKIEKVTFDRKVDQDVTNTHSVDEIVTSTSESMTKEFEVENTKSQIGVIRYVTENGVTRKDVTLEDVVQDEKVRTNVYYDKSHTGIDEKTETINVTKDEVDRAVTDTREDYKKHIIEKKDQCICEICTCGRHRCPHNDVPEPLFDVEHVTQTLTAYKQDYDIKQTTRVQAIHHEDNLHMEGEFHTPERPQWQPVERPKPTRPHDNLQPEGEFTTPEKEEWRPAERPTPVKPQDNLKPEGEFEKHKPEEWRPAERQTPVKPRDNLKPEGDFAQPKHDEWRPAERPVQKKPQDNLKPEGDFEKHKPEEWRPAERITPVKPQDNLKPEGEFAQPKHDEWRPAERPVQKKPQDNLKPEGDFAQPKHDEWRPAERPVQKKPQDNLKPEGDFEKHIPEEWRPAERQSPIKPQDNLKPEGDFAQPKHDEWRPAERPVQKKPQDNLKPEGDFAQPKHDEWRPAERPVQKKPQDNLKPEGEFAQPTHEEWRPAERIVPIKPQDNLKPEGEFEKPKPGEWQPAERPVQKRPQDNLISEGEFTNITTTSTDFTGQLVERPKPVRRNTWTKIEGDFTSETTSKSEYIDFTNVSERVTKVTHRQDNLHTEGEIDFSTTNKEQYTIKDSPIVEKRPRRRTWTKEDFEKFYSTEDLKRISTTQEEFTTYEHIDRRHLIKQTDNLKLEGTFTQPKVEEWRPAERPVQKKPKDNLKPEGEFEKPKHDEWRPAEKSVVIIPKDNLKPEGEFAQPVQEEWRPAERRVQRKPQDNLKPEGEFTKPLHEEWRPAERPVQKKPKDNLKPEGEFEKPKHDEWRPAEKSVVIIPKDNLKPEGEFAQPLQEEWRPAERPVQKKPKDNLKPEGEFEKPKHDEWRPAEKSVVIIPKDNLKPEGEFAQPLQEEWRPAERRVQSKPQDNLKPEGEFTKPLHEEWRPAERPEQKKPKDNLKPEGEFEKPKHDKWRPAEKSVVIIPKDNLKPEGEFAQPVQEEWRPAERPVQKKPQDNLKPEGEFAQPIIEQWRPAEKPIVIKPKDNLKSEGEFEKPKHDEWRPAERVSPSKPKDNLKPEGEFEKQKPDEWRPAERVTPTKPKDNLKPEGEFEKHKSDEWRPAERVTPTKPKDNLKPEGEFEKHKPDEWRPAERVTPTKPKDNLKPEGEFAHPITEQWRPAEKPIVIKPKDNLKPEGKFVKPKHDDWQPAERQSPIKPKDNLKQEGEFEKPKPQQWRPADKPIVIKPQDNLKPEGEFERSKPQEWKPAERQTPKKPKDNLKTEGKFESPKPREWQPAERVTPTKPKDNLKPEGEFTRPEKKVDTSITEKRTAIKKQDNLKMEGTIEMNRRNDFTATKGERVDKVVHQDNLKMEGKMDTRRTRDEFKKIDITEKVVIHKREDNLHSEGEFIDMHSRNDYSVTKGERAPTKIPTDNLKSEGKLYIHETVHTAPAERRRPIKHEDNLKIERQIYEVNTNKHKNLTKSDKAERLVITGEKINYNIEKGDRATVIKHKDNLKMEGKMETIKSSDEYKLVRGEKVKVIKREDNLKIEGVFEDQNHKLDTKIIVDKRNNNITDNVVNIDETKTTIVNQKQVIGAPIVVQPQQNVSIRESLIRSNKENINQVKSSERNDATFDFVSERRTPIRQIDNLKPEGDFERPPAKTWSPAERATVIKHKDNLNIINTHTNGTTDIKMKKMTNQKTELHQQSLSKVTEDRSSKNITQNNVSQTRVLHSSPQTTPRKKLVGGKLVVIEKHSQVESYSTRSPTRMSTRDINGHSTSRQSTREASVESNRNIHEVSNQRDSRSSSRNESKTPVIERTVRSSSRTRHEVVTSQIDSKSLESARHHKKTSELINEAQSNNAILVRKGATSGNEASHSTSTTAAMQKKSLNNLNETGDYISSYNQSSDRKSMSSMHRHAREETAVSSSRSASKRDGQSTVTPERVQKIVSRDNLHIGGDFYGNSESRSYGNFSHVEKIQHLENMNRRSQRVSLGDTNLTTSYKREYNSLPSGPCPASLLESKKGHHFKHTRDTREHKFYSRT